MLKLHQVLLDFLLKQQGVSNHSIIFTKTIQQRWFPTGCGGVADPVKLARQ